jgi:hypothetical protein
MGNHILTGAVAAYYVVTVEPQAIHVGERVFPIQIVLPYVMLWGRIVPLLVPVILGLMVIVEEEVVLTTKDSKQEIVILMAAITRADV